MLWRKTDSPFDVKRCVWASDLVWKLHGPVSATRVGSEPRLSAKHRRRWMLFCAWGITEKKPGSPQQLACTNQRPL